MIVLLRHASTETTDGNLSQAVGQPVRFVYHCFDRIVIQGYLPLLTRPEHIVHFFRDVHGVSPLTKDVLAKRTHEYQQWVEAFARTHRIPIEWPDAEPLKTKKLKQEDYVRPYGQRMARQKRFGVYVICKSLEQGPKFGIRVPKYPTDDPAYRIVTRQRSRYTHSYESCWNDPSTRTLLPMQPFVATGSTRGPAIASGPPIRDRQAAWAPLASRRSSGSGAHAMSTRSTTRSRDCRRGHHTR
jgi:hypothetical protein